VADNVDIPSLALPQDGARLIMERGVHIAINLNGHTKYILAFTLEMQGRFID